MNQTASFEQAIETMKNLRKAAAEGDAQAAQLLALAEAHHPSFVLADLSKYSNG